MQTKRKTTISTESSAAIPQHTHNPGFEQWAKAELTDGHRIVVHDTIQNEHFELVLNPDGTMRLGILK